MVQFNAPVVVQEAAVTPAAVAVYFVMAALPVLAGGSQETMTLPLPGEAITAVGGLGTVMLETVASWGRASGKNLSLAVDRLVRL